MIAKRKHINAYPIKINNSNNQSNPGVNKCLPVFSI